MESGDVILKLTNSKLYNRTRSQKHAHGVIPRSPITKIFHGIDTVDTIQSKRMACLAYRQSNWGTGESEVVIEGGRTDVPS